MTEQSEQNMAKVPELRKKFLDKHYSADKNYYDSRDLSRVKTDDIFVVQFLNGKQGNVDKALKIMIEAMKWRNTIKINDLTEKDIEEEVLNSGVAFKFGKDKKGTTMILSKSTGFTWKGNKEKNESYCKMLALLFENHQREYPGEKLTFVNDCGGSTLANTDMDNAKYVSKILTIYYPDMLESSYVLSFPTIFQAIWKVFKGLVGPIANKYVFPKDQEIFNYVDKDQLPVSFGGESPYEYPRDKDKMADINSNSPDAATS